MFHKVANNSIKGVPCSIIGYGHATIGSDPRFRLVDHASFIEDIMSDRGRIDLFGHKPSFSIGEYRRVVAKWINQTGIVNRPFFDGTTAELGIIAAQKCLANTNVDLMSIDMIIGATNTGSGYPSLADYVKLGLLAKSSAGCFDVTEACPSNTLAIFQGWSLIRSGVCKKVLVVCAEKATTLALVDNWMGSNLFGDGAFAVLLSTANAEPDESFIFFDFQSMPFDGNIDGIVKTASGFTQDGPKVHKFVGITVVETLVNAINSARIDPASIKHLVPHQPSGKTLTLLKKKFEAKCPDFEGVFHDDVKNTGNTSSASTGILISQRIEEGTIQKSDLVVVVTFGSGLSIGTYGFYA